MTHVPLIGHSSTLQTKKPSVLGTLGQRAGQSVTCAQCSSVMPSRPRYPPPSAVSLSLSPVSGPSQAQTRVPGQGAAT